MARFTVRAQVPIPAEEAWERVLDLRAQEAIIPFTTVRRVSAPGEDPPSEGGLRVGTRFVGRTALGPVGFDDPMVVETLRPPGGDAPGFARIRKEGRVIGGWIDLTVAREAPGSSRVQWAQEISVRGVPRVLGPIVSVVARAAYGWAIRRLLQRD
jgi:carbon monoxide dehydrogenase subunit G